MMFLSLFLKISKHFIYFIFVLLALLLLLTGIGLFTHAGNNLIFDSLEKLEPRLSISLTDGTILNSPTYQQIKWADGEMLFEFNQLSYEFDWHCLLDELCLDSLTLDSAEINIVSGESEPEVEEETAPFVLNFRIPVHIKSLDISNTNVKVAGVEIDVKNLLLSASGINNDLTIDSTISGLTVVLADSIESNDTEIKDSEIKDSEIKDSEIKDSEIKDSEIKEASTKSSVNKKTGPINKPESFPAILAADALPEVILPFNLITKKLNINGFKLIKDKQDMIVVNQAKSKFTYFGSLIDIDKLIFDLPEADLNLTGNINLTSRYPMDLALIADVKSIASLEPSDLLNGQHIELSTQGNLGDLESTIILTNLIDATVRNNIDLYSQNLPHTLSVEWDKFVWPLKGDAQITSQSGIVSSNGNLSNYLLNIETDYSVKDVPPGKVNLQGQGNLTSLSLSQLLVNTLQGQLLLKGDLDWVNNITWNGDLNIKNINFEELSENYPAYLNGDIKQSVTIPVSNDTVPKWAFDLPVIALNGAFLDRPLTINGAVKGDAKQGFIIKDINILNAKNSLKINGKVSEKNDLSIQLAIKDLSKIIIDSAGSIMGNVNLAGSIDQIEINTKLQASKIIYLDNSIEQLNLDGKASLGSIPVADLTVNVKNIVANNQVIDSVTVQLSPEKIEADSVAHAIDFDLKSNIATTKLDILFIQELTKWEAKLNTGLVESVQGIWMLNRPFTASVEKENINVTPHCWLATNKDKDSNGKICINKFSAGDDGNIVLNIDDFVLNTLSPFIPSELVLEGSVDADVNLLWKNKQKPDVDILIDGKSIALNIKADKVQKDFIHYPVEKFHIAVKTNQEKTDFLLQAASDGLLNANFKGYLTPYKNTPEINATFDLLIPDFDAFSILIPEVDKLTGQLKADLIIDGKLQKPVAKGQVLIADVSVTAVGAPVQVADLNAEVDINKNHANIEGYFFTNTKKPKEVKERTLVNELVSFKDTAISTVNIPQRIANMKNTPKTNEAANGRADITGFFDWKKKLKGNIHFEADQMYIQDYGKIELYVSPNIDLKFGETIELEGLITVDKGNITIKDLPEGAVNVSKDVIVVDAKEKKDASDLPIKMNLKVALGQSLRVKAIGLDSYIHGDLLIRKALQKELTMHGELTFSQGSYRALAQQLVIQKSRIVFQGQPDSPYLNIEAIRDPNNIEDNVTAGVRVTGTPDQLQLTIFSDPSMSQQNALSYITRGRSIENSAEDGTSSQLAAVLIDIGAGKTDGVMQDIGSKIGINDLSLSSSGQGDEQSVGIRGTLAPGVELSYGVGVFDSFTILAVRYELFEKFYIEASSGLYEAVDVYYEWDWD